MRTCAAIVCVAAMATGVARAGDAPPIFESMEFGKAVEATKGNESVLLVMFSAEACEPCVKMFATTWRDDTLAAWLRSIGRVIAVDSDRERQTAAASKIETLPTILAIKNGTEFDRMVGFQRPEEILMWVSGVQRGVRAADNPELKQIAGDVGVNRRRGEARALLDQKRYDEATAEYVLVWRNAPETRTGSDPAWRSYMVAEMRRLAESHVRARDVFRAIRDATEGRLKGATRTFVDLDDWIALNEVIGDQDSTLAWFDRIKADEGSMSTLRRHQRYLHPLLESRERWADMGLLIVDYNAEVGMAWSSRWGVESEMKDQAERDAALPEMDAFWLGKVRHGIAALVAAGRLDDARKVADTATRLDTRDVARVAVIEGTLLAGKPQEEHRAWLDDMAARQTLNRELRARWDKAMAELAK